MSVDADVESREGNEKLSLRIIGVCSVALAGYIAYESVSDLIRKTSPEHSIPGIVLACVSLIVMPMLSRAKKKVGKALGSAAINYSFELILCSEHTIDRSAHLFQNKSRRQAIHHFELIRLTRTNFKSIGLHSFDGDFNHVFHLHDRSAFHVFNIKVIQEFGLCRRRC
jgi:hypothetical protein